ncbi:RDD family protein [uncultured Jannaschia sp.]|uniref:RDD family protein n=1 Tax=uncultured Jannaschia sp. TaxID=293347 RepID=UPI00263A0BF6|nr:RDD family protein [uncultured Jannaschia sp.]
MTQWSDVSTRATSRLPNPVAAPEFYDGVAVKRGVAWIVDTIVITLLTILAGVLTLTIGFFLWPLFFLGIGFLYRIATIAGGSATWGMRLMGVELRGHDGERFDLAQSIAHVGGYYASVVTVVPWFLSIATIAATPRRQSLTDFVLGSAAINRPG